MNWRVSRLEGSPHCNRCPRTLQHIPPGNPGNPAAQPCALPGRYALPSPSPFRPPFDTQTLGEASPGVRGPGLPTTAPSSRCRGLPGLSESGFPFTCQIQDNPRDHRPGIALGMQCTLRVERRPALKSVYTERVCVYWQNKARDDCHIWRVHL